MALGIIHLRNQAGMTVRVPHTNNTQPCQEGAPPPLSVNDCIQGDSIAAISQTALRSDAVGHSEENASAQNINYPNDGNADNNDEGKVDEAFSPRNQESSDNHEADDDTDLLFHPSSIDPRRCVVE